MRGSVEALDMLLDAMLDVSSLDAGIIVPHETTFSLATLIERLVAEFELTCQSGEISLRLVLGARRSSGQTRRCSTEFCRIMSNALRYTSQGGILIKAGGAAGSCVSKVDPASGIPKDLQHEIFKEFFQIGNPERDRTQGLGLGLAIVQRLSRLLHCPVTVRSQGGGAAFGRRGAADRVQ